MDKPQVWRIASATPDPTVTFPAARHQTAPWPVPNYTAWWQGHVHEQLARGCYLKAWEWKSNPQLSESQVQRPNHYATRPCSTTLQPVNINLKTLSRGDTNHYSNTVFQSTVNFWLAATFSNSAVLFNCSLPVPSMVFSILLPLFNQKRFSFWTSTYDLDLQKWAFYPPFVPKDNHLGQMVQNFTGICLSKKLSITEGSKSTEYRYWPPTKEKSPIGRQHIFLVLWLQREGMLLPSSLCWSSDLDMTLLAFAAEHRAAGGPSPATVDWYLLPPG